MELFLILLLGMFGLLVAGVVMTVLFVVKAVFWLVTLPFRLLFWALFVPFWIAKVVLKGIAAIVFVPLMAIGGVLLGGLGLILGLALVLTPLLPLLIVGALLWAVVRSFRLATA